MDGANPAVADDKPLARARAGLGRRRARCSGSSSAGCSSTPASPRWADPLTAERAVQAYEIFPDGPRQHRSAWRCPSSRSSSACCSCSACSPGRPPSSRPLLMVAFIIGISQAWARGLTIDCGCFGGGGADRRQRDQVPAGDRPRRRLRPRRRVAVVAPPLPRIARPHTCSDTEGDPEPPWPRSPTTTAASARQAKIQAAQKSQGSGANKIVVATVVVVVAIIAVVGGRHLVAEPEGGGHRQRQRRCRPARRIGKGYPAFARTSRRRRARPTVDLYEDFQCPVCARSRRALGSDLPGPRPAQGKIKLNYHVLNFLDDKTGAKNSTPAANGAFCAADAGQVPGVPQRGLRRTRCRRGRRTSPTPSSGAWASTAGITGDALTTWQKCVRRRHVHRLRQLGERGRLQDPELPGHPHRADQRQGRRPERPSRPPSC